METVALIPFAAVLVSAAFGAVSIAWDSDRRATRSMGALFLCTGFWALIDLFTYVETDAARALMWMRWCHVGPLLLGPCVLWVLSELLPNAPERLLRRAKIGALVFLPVGIASALVPGSIVEMVATDYGGWRPVLGPVSIVLMPIGFVFPIYAAIEATRSSARQGHSRIDNRRAWTLRASVLASLIVILPTEYVLPILGISAPRLGAFAVSLSAVVAWMHVLHAADDLAVTPQGVARGVLGKLRDGVALIRLDGTVLSTNARFSEMAGCKAAEILGMSLDRLTDAPIERVRLGLRDRKAILHAASGAAVPVSLSSSVARNRTGDEIGVVVVFRDLREVDALKNQLMNSGRLAAIGELAAGIAHEVNNPLAFIRSDLNILAKRTVEIRAHIAAAGRFDHEVLLFERSERRVKVAMAGIERVTQVVSDVREFAHLGGAGQGGSDPASVVDGAIRLARLQRGSDVELRIAGVTCSQWIDFGQELKQILLALFGVLSEATEKGGCIEANLRTDDRQLTLGLSARPLAVSPAEILDRFEALGEDRRQAGETELSLGVAAELVARLGGQVSIDPIGDRGVRLELGIPLDAQAGA